MESIYKNVVAVNEIAHDLSSLKSKRWFSVLLHFKIKFYCIKHLLHIQ